MNNSLAYDLYKLILMHSLNLDVAEIINRKFDSFYDLLTKEDFDGCESILIDIRELMGADHPDIVRASVSLDFEKTWDEGMIK